MKIQHAHRTIENALASADSPQHLLRTYTAAVASGGL